MRRLVLLLVGLVVLGAPAGASAEGACPNEGLREARNQTFLDDCRAYELVSPPDKHGGNVMAMQERTRSAADGNAVQYASTTAFADAHGTNVAVDYIAQRGNDGWATHSVMPAQDPYTTLVTPPSNQTMITGDLSSDLSTGLMYAIRPLTSAPNVQQVPNLYLRRDFLSPGAGTFQLLSDSFAPLPPFTGYEDSIVVAGASKDFSHVIFETRSDLTPDATGGEPKLYEWENGTLRLAGILPNGEQAPVSHAGRTETFTNGTPYYTPNMISSDGSRVFFTDGEHGSGNIYMRVDHSTTVQLNVPENGDSTSLPNARLWTATPDGLHVFFTDNQSLTEDSPEAIGEGGNGTTNLFRYDVIAPVGHHITLISKDHERVIGDLGVVDVVGISQDGSYVYFRTGKNRLLSGQPELPFPGEPIYVWHDGTIAYVGISHGFSNINFEEFSFTYLLRGLDSRVTKDGALVYQSNTPQTSYDTTCTPVFNGSFDHCGEVYLYDPSVGSPVCLSCDPSGAPPVDNASTEMWDNVSGGFGYNQHVNNLVSADGNRIFFNSPDALVPQDTNGEYDVYEYYVPAHEARLVSSGQGSDGAFFTEASPDGSNVFFVTRESLVGQDTDFDSDLYDARVGGGIAAQDPTPAVECVGDACQGAPSGAPSLSAPASLTLAGGGNVAAAPTAVGGQKPKAKAKPKAKKRVKKRRRRARRARKARKASANSSRSAGR